MNSFNFLCWVPSQKNYFRLKELNFCQYELILKYIINNDDEGLEKCFDEVLINNLPDNVKINKFDKWFILCFLRAVCISPVSVYKVKTEENNTAAADISILEMLEKISDKTLKDRILINLQDAELVFTVPNGIATQDILKESLFAAVVNKEEVILTEKEKDIILSKMSDALKQLAKSNISNQLDDHSFKLLSRLEQFGVKSPSFRITDNTLFEHVKRLYSLWSNVFHEKKYTLINKVGFNVKDIMNMTPLECDVYINHYKQEQRAISKKLKTP
jgi:hypothetical protein